MKLLADTTNDQQGRHTHTRFCIDSLLHMLIVLFFAEHIALVAAAAELPFYEGYLSDVDHSLIPGLTGIYYKSVLYIS